MTSVDTFVVQQNGYRSANGIALDYNATGNVPTGGNAVVGFQNYSFSSGYGTVVLDGPKTSYAVQVDSTGKTTIKDIGTGDAAYGQTITVTGESYIVFNGANLAANTVTVGGAATYPNDSYFVENAANAQVAEFYAAMLQRIPDLGGLEYWLHQAATSGGIIGVAESFISYIHSSYSTNSPVATLGGDPNAMTSTQFVTALYENVLGRAPDTEGLNYWGSQMDAWTAQYGLLQSQAQILVSFTNATASSSAVNLVAGSAAGTGSGWLINYSATGGYADPGLQQSLSTVLANETNTNYLNTSLIDPSTIPTTGSPNANGISISTGNVGTGVITSPTTPATTIVLSAAVPFIAVDNDGDTLISAPNGGCSFTVFGSNTDIQLNGTGNTLNFGGEYATQTGKIVVIPNPTVTNNYVMGYVPGADHVYAGMLGLNHSYYSLPVQVLAQSSSTPLSGSSLNFGTNEYVLDVGNVGSGSAAEVAAAANAIYKVADINGNSALAKAAASGESLVIIGQAGSNAVIYQWATITADSAHPMGVAIATADTNGNHLIDASEIHLVATLVGVTASALTSADFQ